MIKEQAAAELNENLYLVGQPFLRKESGEVVSVVEMLLKESTTEPEAYMVLCRFDDNTVVELGNLTVGYDPCFF